MPALIFDYDGLIVDSERVIAEAIIGFVAEHGTDITVAEIGHLFGTTEADDEWDALLAGWCRGQVTLRDVEQHLTPTIRAGIDGLPLLPGVTDVLDEAKGAGWPVGLATGSSRQRVEARLAEHGILDRFDTVVTAADVAVGKPAPDIYLETARRLDVAPSECVVLEDSVPGCAAALAAGMTVVACPSTVSAHMEFPRGVRRVGCLTEVRLADLR